MEAEETDWDENQGIKAMEPLAGDLYGISGQQRNLLFFIADFIRVQ